MEEKLETGCDVLTAFLEGGYEKGVITTLYGPASSGKTTTCLLAAIAACKQGKVIFIDTEGGFSTERLKQLMPDYKKILDKIFIYKALTFAEQKHCIETISAKLPPHVELIICDTITSLYRVERGGDNAQLNTELGKQLGMLLASARKNNIAVLITNQVYADFQDKTQVRMVGGDIMKYASKCLIELQILHGKQRKALLRKHRSIPDKETTFEIRQEGLVPA